MNKQVILIYCLGLFSLQWVSGQGPTPEKPEKPAVAGRRAWVVATTMPEDVANPLLVIAGDKVHKVSMFLRSIGQVIPLDKSGIVRAVKEVKLEDGEVTYENLSFSKIPEGVNEALIVLVPNVEGEGKLRFRSKVIDLGKFKKGGCLYVNLVSTKIGVQLGDLKKVIASGEMEFINPLVNKDKAVMYVGFFYEIPKDDKNDKGEWKLMTSGKMAIYKSRREICIFFYNKQIDNVDFRGIPFITPREITPRENP